ncbi:spermidine/putrescine ABC transporter permease PotC [Candidatus Uabimicrobium amorphum]|uniref:Spermidine/putrescine transport system permease protein PotC n=1 Tax=Uabimicrobium amorphum TaxID=2596890 RepID=A0A5S9IM80_UABAM|nr:spermidine/putrescine ABC transporter permease PotC [Candidatus Uabimicrobium amorphum]BBM84294.1 spermidine/putrescine ABC transporter permease PotC [Candidatus Uabimicrobium amorphum]
MKKFSKYLYLFVVFVFLYIPIFTLILYSFNKSTYSVAWKGWTWSWYTKLLANDSLIETAIHSLILAATSSTLATIIGTLTAIAIFRYRFFGKKLLSGLIYIVMMSPDIVMAISLLVLFLLIKIELGFWTLLLSHITFCLPFVIITLQARLSQLNKHLIEAAEDLGANEYQTLRYVLVPVLFPAIAAGWLLSFTLSMDDVIISFFVTGPQFEILPLKIYSLVRLGVKPEVNALCTIMFIFTFFVVMVSQFLIKEK